MYNLVYQLQCSSMRFHSYNFTLNEVPNNNNIMCVANVVLNEMPNNDDITRVGNVVLNEAPNSNDAMHNCA